MTTEGERTREPTDQMLSDMVRDADEYYAQLSRRHVSETRLHVAVVSIVVWFAAFVVLGVGVYFTIARAMMIQYLLAAFLGAIATGVAAGTVMYAIRRRRGFKFAELGALLDKMKVGKTASEDGLRLTDVMHRVALTARKQRLDSAFEYGVAAFILVSLMGLNAGIGGLAGVIVYLYFRFEAFREYEREDARYEDSKKELLLNL
jgi:ABC-type multidrug transport system fused ATPase/permease subunit